MKIGGSAQSMKGFVGWSYWALKLVSFFGAFHERKAELNLERLVKDLQVFGADSGWFLALRKLFSDHFVGTCCSKKTSVLFRSVEFHSERILGWLEGKKTASFELLAIQSWHQI